MSADAPSEARGFFPARIGALLTAPPRALSEIERNGGGLRDALWLVVVGVLCFRSDDLARAVFAVSHVALGGVLRQVLGILSRELQEAAFVILPAAVGLTLLAGRGRRDPSRDIELASGCFVPFFAIRAVARTLSLPGLIGPLPLRARSVVFWIAAAATFAFFVIALRIARRRDPIARSSSADAPAVAATSPAAAPMVEPTPPEVAPPIAAPTLPARSALASRLAATALAAVVGVALFANI